MPFLTYCKVLGILMVEFFSQAILKYREFFRRSGSLLLYRGKVFRGQKNENNDTGVLFLHEIINKQCLLAKNNSIRATAH